MTKPDQTSPKPTQGRCAICGWELCPRDEMCVRGNCSLRPAPAVVYDPDRAIAEGYKREFIDARRGPSRPEQTSPTPEERAELIVHGKVHGCRCARCEYASNQIRAAEQATREKEREACANVADKWAAHYPSEIFRDDAEDSIACMSAKHGRLVAKNIAEDVRARRGDAPEPILEEDKRLGTSDEHGCTVAIQKTARRAALEEASKKVPWSDGDGCEGGWVRDWLLDLAKEEG